MIALSDSQLQIVIAAATPLPVEKRGAFLERVAGRLHLNGHRRSDDDVAVEQAVRAALRGLMQELAA